MARDPGVRQKARRLYIDGHGYARISARVKVPVGTLKRWGAEEKWAAARRQVDALGERMEDLIGELVEAAAESRDPQQVYAAGKAARLAGWEARTPPAPTARSMAWALLQELARDGELGPIIRRRKAELVDLVAEAAERLEEAA